MSGEYKSSEILHRLTLRRDFGESVKNLRNKYKIPSDGFKTKKIAKQWVTKRNFVHYYIGLSELLRIYDKPLSAGLIHHLDNHILTNGRFNVSELSSKTSLLSIEPQDSPLGPSVKIWIYPEASHGDIRDFIDSNWNTIKFFKNRWVGLNTRVGRTQNKKRNQFIIELYRQTRKDLLKMAGNPKGSGFYKEKLIALIVSKRISRVSSEAVKKVWLRHKSNTRDM
jgi:hypothetical protein